MLIRSYSRDSQVAIVSEEEAPQEDETYSEQLNEETEYCSEPNLLSPEMWVFYCSIQVVLEFLGMKSQNSVLPFQ